jgi:threonylcarbamoyladenosine tRNA methylthiotransferase MtaB
MGEHIDHPHRNVMLVTLGCKINQYDTNSMVSHLRGEGHGVVNKPADADVIVVNTCTVTGRTDYKGRQLVRKAIHQNRSAVIIVTGCYAEVQAEKIAEIPGVDYVLGNTEKQEIAEWVSRGEKRETPLIRAGMISEARSLGSEATDVHSGTTRAFLKIQDGCNHACSYCIIPRARGRSRSLPLSRVKQKIDLLAEEGFLEVVLSGIHLGVYGQDLDPSVSLLDLLRDLEGETSIPRIRISSIEPNELTDGLLDLFAASRRLCPHFHLPLQSGDPDVLEAMNRPYGPEDFASLVHRIRERMPEAAIGVDVIAGFPGEGERAFSNTLELLEGLPVTYLHVFPYSPRPGTPAASFPDPVQPEQIRKRAGVLRKMGTKKRLDFYSRTLHKEREVLVETKRDRKTGLLKGVSRNYVPVLFEGPDSLQARLVRVRIRAVEGRDVFGVLVDGFSGDPAGPTGHLDNGDESDKMEGLGSKQEKAQEKTLLRE